MNLFYAPEIKSPEFKMDASESKHIVKVLRMSEGDELFFTDGKGFFYKCTITVANPHGCMVKVLEKIKGDDKRDYLVYMAVAPTKNINRYEWFLEKATEIGVDRFLPFISKHSERKSIKTERLNRVITAAVKQSLKSFHPQLDEQVDFNTLINTPFEGQKFIAYIHPEVTLELSKAYKKGNNAFVLIGPEGDFTPEEVEKAKEKGFVPVRLGPSRLRTETAGVTACHTVNLLNWK